MPQIINGRVVIGSIANNLRTAFKDLKKTLKTLPKVTMQGMVNAFEFVAIYTKLMRVKPEILAESTGASINHAELAKLEKYLIRAIKIGYRFADKASDIWMENFQMVKGTFNPIANDWQFRVCDLVTKLDQIDCFLYQAQEYNIAGNPDEKPCAMDKYSYLLKELTKPDNNAVLAQVQPLAECFLETADLGYIKENAPLMYRTFDKFYTLWNLQR